MLKQSRILFISSLFMLLPLFSGCAVLDLFAPDKVEAALVKVELQYGSLLDKSIEYRQQGLVPDKVAESLTRLMDRFESGVSRINKKQADSQAEADNLDQYITTQLNTVGLDKLREDYLRARQQALDRMDQVDASELDRLRAENAAKRALWDQLI
jgi:hypothetical protein